VSKIVAVGTAIGLRQRRRVRPQPGETKRRLVVPTDDVRLISTLQVEIHDRKALAVGTLLSIGRIETEQRGDGSLAVFKGCLAELFQGGA